VGGKKSHPSTFISFDKRKRIVYIHVTQQLSELKSLGNKIRIQKTPILGVPGLSTKIGLYPQEAINTVRRRKISITKYLLWNQIWYFLLMPLPRRLPLPILNFLLDFFPIPPVGFKECKF